MATQHVVNAGSQCSNVQRPPMPYTTALPHSARSYLGSAYGRLPPMYDRLVVNTQNLGYDGFRGVNFRDRAEQKSRMPLSVLVTDAGKGLSSKIPSGTLASDRCTRRVMRILSTSSSITYRIMPAQAASRQDLHPTCNKTICSHSQRVPYRKAPSSRTRTGRG